MKYNKIIEKLQTYNNIAILGFGMEGKSTYNFIRRYDKDMFITILDAKEQVIDDKNAIYKKYNATQEELEEYDLIIKTPGIAIHHIRDEIRKKITSQTEILLEFYGKNVIGITGTKGKSTTTSLLYKVLSDQLDNVYLVGNIGIPILDDVESFDNAIIVDEMSSNQLEYVKFSPHIGIITNLFLDHLDHSDSIEEYHEAKMNVMTHQDKDDYGIYDDDNYYMSKQDTSKIKSKLLGVSLEKKSDIYLKDEKIYLGKNVLLNLSDLKTKLKGDHNLKNIMMVLLCASIYNLDLDKTLKSISEFEPLEHRMEYVGTFKDIEFYNDSIATIPEATINACKTIKNVDSLIFGGLERNIEYKDLVEYLNNSSIGNFICMPSTGHKLAQKLDQKRVILVNTLEEAVDKAYEVTKKKCSCLLSPAAASYEYFKNFEEKGRCYKDLVKQKGK